MSCQVELFADCGDISSLGRALFIPEKEDTSWLTQCTVSLSPCGNLLAVGYRSRLCLLTSQWIRSTDRNTYLISWSGTLPANITSMLALSICPSHHSSQNGPDWFCIIVGFNNGSVAFYTNTGHQLSIEKLDDTPVLRISCHTGSYGTLPDDIHVLFTSCVCIITGASLFQLLRNAKAQLAKVQAGIQENYSVDNRGLGIRKWSFSEQDQINDAAVVGLELKNSYDHLLAASTYGGYDTWYRSIPPMNTLVLGAGARPFVGFHYALEGGTAPPLQDVARAVAHRIKSALPGWLGGGGGAERAAGAEAAPRAEPLSLRAGLRDPARAGVSVAVSPDRRLAAVADGLGRVSVLDVARGHLVRLFKGYRDAQCAFLQVFEQDSKKPQLSVIKEVRRATFLIIYNPKKGLIDIRLMQRGNRVAVFTATKNGKLLYNTCGLVGAEKSYTHKKLNLPEFQCVLIDPDGKLKKFSVPFFHALEGEHSDRSKDLHILRELREFVKKNLTSVENYENDIIEKASKLKTIELQKHCLEMFIRNYEIPPKIIISCLTLFWENIEKLDSLTSQEIQIKRFFANIGLLALFYRNINNENTDDMTELMIKIYSYLGINSCTELCVSVDDKQENESPDFCLLEDDNCILERLLILSQENGYKENHPRVTFVEIKSHKFKELISCFLVEENSRYLSLKPELPQEKINKLAADVFKSVFEIQDVSKLSDFLKKSILDPKDIVKLIIMHLMIMPLEEISLDLIEKLISVLYYTSKATEEATKISYNEISPWWQSIRDLLVDMSCPLRSMIVAMACKAVGKIYEIKCSEGEEDAWESLTTENAKWGILIGKLEDISLLAIILMFKDKFDGDSLPKLQFDDISINLKYIYSRGKGSVTELIAKWLCGMGVVPEAIVANELMENRAASYEDLDDDSASYPFVENNRVHVDNNPKIFKWLSLLRQQFPLSTSADYILANMCWEYAMAWQKDMQHIEKLNVVVSCLKNISNTHLRLGLFAIIWTTYIRHIFEASCRLVNKVGKMPKEPLCLQDVGLGNTAMVNFLETTTKYLDEFLKCSTTPTDQDKPMIQFEKIWDESTPSLMEVAQDTKRVNNDILSLNYQISCTIYYQCHFNIKSTKPLDTLYDIDYQYIFEALTGSVVDREISMRGSEKLRNPRMKFVTKLIRAAVETVTARDRGGYDSAECEQWMDRIAALAELWNIDADFLKRQQVVGLYHLGYDSLAAEAAARLREPAPALPPLLAITTQRLKRSLERSTNQPEWIVCVPPHLYKRLQNTVQYVGLYHLGYDSLAAEAAARLREPAPALPPLLAITTQRLKRSLERSTNQPEWIVCVPPHLYKRLQNTVQYVGLYHLGYDSLAAEAAARLREPAPALPPLLAITTQRLKRSLERSTNQPEWIVCVPPHLYKRLQNTVQYVGLYHLGYDSLAAEAAARLREPAPALPPLLAITTQRLKRSLERSTNQPEWIVCVPPHLYKRLQNTVQYVGLYHLGYDSLAAEAAARLREPAPALPPLLAITTQRLKRSLERSTNQPEWIVCVPPHLYKRLQNTVQYVGLYHLGYDSLAAGAAARLREPAPALPPLLAITTQRLKRSLERSTNQPEWIVCVPPHLYKRLQNTVQYVGLYHLGYDSLAAEAAARLREPAPALPPLLAITTQRLKRSLERSTNQPEWIVCVPPHLYKRLQNTVQYVGLYHLGYDSLAAEAAARLREPAPALPPLLAITTQRLKRSLERSTNQPEWIVCVPPHLYKRLQNTVQYVGLYHLGYDSLAAEAAARLREPAPALPPLLAITTQRLKRSLERSTNQPEWIVCVPPHLYKRLQNTVLDTSIPAHPCLETTIIVLQTILLQCDKKTKEGMTDLQNIKLAQLIIESCQVLIRKKL